MSFLDFFRKNKEKPKNVLMYEDIYGHSYIGPGYSVSQSTVVGQSAAWACINLLASSIASLPITLYSIDDNGKKKQDTSDPLYNVLRFSPNVFQTPHDFIQMQMFALLVHGESFARIYKDSRGNVTSLIPLNNNGVTVQLNKEGTNLIYLVSYTDRNTVAETLTASQVLHIRGLFSDILRPVSPITACRETFAINGTLHAHEMAFFGENAARPGGVIEAAGKVAPSTIKRILSIFNKTTAGVHNAGKTLFLEEGLKFQPFALSNIDAQFIEAMKFSIPEVCRIFGVPPSLIHDNEKSTFSNAEQQSLAFVTYSLRPYIEKFEAAMMKALVSSRAWQSTEINFDVTALLRGDATTQSNYVSKLVQNAIMTPNEGREFLGLSSTDQEGSDKLFIQANMSPLTIINQPPIPAPIPQPIAPVPESTPPPEDSLNNTLFVANNLLDMEKLLTKGQKI